MRREDAISILDARLFSEESIIETYNKKVQELQNDNNLDPIQKLMKKSKLDEAKDFLLKNPIEGSKDVTIEYDHDKGKSFEIKSTPRTEPRLVDNYINLRANELREIYIGKESSEEDNPVDEQIERFVEGCVYANGQTDRIDQLADSCEQKIIYILNEYIEEVLKREMIVYLNIEGVYHVGSITICAQDGWNTINRKLIEASSRSRLKETITPAFEKIDNIMEVAGDVKDITLRGIKGLFKKRK